MEFALQATAFALVCLPARRCERSQTDLHSCNIFLECFSRDEVLKESLLSLDVSHGCFPEHGVVSGVSVDLVADAPEQAVSVLLLVHDVVLQLVAQQRTETQLGVRGSLEQSQITRGHRGGSSTLRLRCSTTCALLLLLLLDLSDGLDGLLREGAHGLQSVGLAVHPLHEFLGPFVVLDVHLLAVGVHAHDGRAMPRADGVLAVEPVSHALKGARLHDRVRPRSVRVQQRQARHAVASRGRRHVQPLVVLAVKTLVVHQQTLRCRSGSRGRGGSGGRGRRE